MSSSQAAWPKNSGCITFYCFIIIYRSYGPEINFMHPGKCWANFFISNFCKIEFSARCTERSEINFLKRGHIIHRWKGNFRHIKLALGMGVWKSIFWLFCDILATCLNRCHMAQISLFSKRIIPYIIGKEISCAMVLFLRSGVKNQYFGYFAAF